MNRLRKASLLIATAAVALAGVIVPAATASAASCSGLSCAGHDPAVYGCISTSSTSSAVTSGADVATIVNYFSSGCDANWGYAYLNAAAEQAGWSLEIQTYTHDRNDNYEISCFPGPNNTGSPDEWCPSGYPTYNGSNGWPAWSDMVDGANKVYAEIFVYDGNGKYVNYAIAAQ